MRVLALLTLSLLLSCERHSDIANASIAAIEIAPRNKTGLVVPGARSTEYEEPTASEFPSRFFGKSDDEARRSLREEEIVEVKKGRGGRSLAFKLTLADGTLGYYKPEQTFSSAHWYAELMAYYLDRELGFGRVPPAVGRRIKWEILRPYAKGDKRIEEIVVQDDGTVRGAFIWWLNKKPTRLTTGRNWERWIRVDGPLHISPYQAPIDWRKDRKSGEASEQHWPLAKKPDTPERPSELSDMILFDYLCTNVDRWGGENENVRTYGKDGPLLFFDNGAGFSPGRARIPLMDSRLRALQRFVPSTRKKLDGLDLDKLHARMKTDALYPFLPERSWDGLVTRLIHARTYLADLETRFGDRNHLTAPVF